MQQSPSTTPEGQDSITLQGPSGHLTGQGSPFTRGAQGTYTPSPCRLHPPTPQLANPTLLLPSLVLNSPRRSWRAPQLENRCFFAQRCTPSVQSSSSVLRGGDLVVETGRLSALSSGLNRFARRRTATRGPLCLPTLVFYFSTTALFNLIFNFVLFFSVSLTFFLVVFTLIFSSFHVLF